jgi:hypothetical protein
LNNFREVESYRLKNCSQNGVKKHEKPGSKNLLLQAPQKNLLFLIFLLVLPLFRDTPQSPLEFSNFWLAEFQANTQRNNPQKTELRYLQNLIFYKFINKGGTYVPSRH